MNRTAEMMKTLALLLLASSAVVPSEGQVNSGTSVVGDLLQPFDYKLGRLETACSFQGQGDWGRPEHQATYGKDSPLSEVTIYHNNHAESYGITYWKGKVASISRDGLYGKDDAAALQAYKELFPALRQSLRVLGCSDSIPYSEDYHEVCNGNEIRARVLPMHDDVIAQYEFSVAISAAQAEIHDFYSSKEKDRTTRAQEATRFMAMSECSRPFTGKSGKTHEIRIGLTTLVEGKEACEAVGRQKATNMAAGGWSCTADASPFSCVPVLKEEEELLQDVLNRRPVWNTYLVFTDVEKHFTHISFSNLPAIAAGPLCEVYRQEIIAAGVTDAQCILGNNK